MLEALEMFLNKQQFGELASRPMKLNKGVAKSYPTLSEYLNMELKQRQLLKGTCYPWQLNCQTTPHL
jgi:hypothetical protein